MTTSHAPTVAIVQRRLTGYRVPFFEALKVRMEQEGVHLRLFHGVGSAVEITKDDAGHIDWAEPLDTSYVAHGRLCWQPFARQVAGSDLLILTQENAMLANHLALILRPAPRLAFWGHGGNLQGDARSLRERYKRWSTRRVDWYFAYTKLSVGLVDAMGFPHERITCVNNAIDIGALKIDLASISSDELDVVRDGWGLTHGPIGVYIGSFYDHKRIRFLIEVAEALRARVDGFQMLIVGAGPDRPIVESAAERHNWIRYVGVKRGREKAAVLRMGAILMNPGLVGLGILDGFAAGVPMLTTDCGLHSPEIAYLTPDNGVMTPDDLGSYINACAHLLTDEAQHARLVIGCRAAAERYTLPNMVENFTQGVLQALKAA